MTTMTTKGSLTAWRDPYLDPQEIDSGRTHPATVGRIADTMWIQVTANRVKKELRSARMPMVISPPRP